MYEILSKSDFQTGATLTVSIPEDDVDKKALYTLLSDQPDFILPFRHRAVDGQIEFTYHIGSRHKLAYMSGSRTPDEYSDLWSGILQPILDCGDYFMTPYSFVFLFDYIYCDKNGGEISFVYVPSKHACSDYNELKSMVTDVARQNRVTDIMIENKVIWSIQDFNINDFMQMVRQFKPSVAPIDPPAFAPAPAPVLPIASAPKHAPMPPPLPPLPLPPKPAHPKQPTSKLPIDSPSSGIVINFPPDDRQQAKERKKGLFGKKKDSQLPKPPEVLGDNLKPAHEKAVIPNSPEAWASRPTPAIAPTTGADNNLTQVIVIKPNTPKFRYVGNSGDHPIVIEVDIKEGEIFTIGRFDSSLGIKQSNFEFDKSLKTISRRHAAIERTATGYYIIDLGSTTGTYINGRKMPPSAPFLLENGCHITFGYSGVYYVWNEA